MLPLLRTASIAVAAFLLASNLLQPARGQVPAQPATLSTTASIPARLDVVIFEVHSEGEAYKLVVTPSPSLLRVDAPRDALTVIYDPRSQYYLGLENRNYTYWEFSWPEVKAVVESSKRYESRLREFGADSLNDAPPSDSAPASALSLGNPLGDTSSIPNSTSTNSATAGATPASDDSGYIWQTTTTRKRIAGLDCVLWNGTSQSSDPVQAWCYAGLQPVVQNALTQLRAINEPMALVPVRNLVPPFVFEVVTALKNGGVTPLLITWGDHQEKSAFQLEAIKTREGKPSLFAIPKLYVKTTLVTMDGMGKQKPQEGVTPLPQPPDMHPNPVR